jgi:hypothetical protein
VIRWTNLPPRPPDSASEDDQFAWVREHRAYHHALIRYKGLLRSAKGADEGTLIELMGKMRVLSEDSIIGDVDINAAAKLSGQIIRAANKLQAQVKLKSLEEICIEQGWAVADDST